MTAGTQAVRYRHRTGCYTCRQRKKRCDERFNSSASCRTCVRLGLECLAPRNILATITRSSAVDPTTGSSVCEGLSPGQPVNTYGSGYNAHHNASWVQSSLFRGLEMNGGYSLGPGLIPVGGEFSYEDRELVHYFTNHLITKRTVIPVEQSGFYMLISRAFQEPELMSALLASASAHQLQCMADTETNYPFAQKARGEYGKALGRFSRYLQGDQMDVERALACAILLTFTDIIWGGTNEWHHHLLGAIAIVNSARSRMDQQNNVFHRFITRFLIYHDVLAAVAMSTSTALDLIFYEQEEQQLVSDNLHSVAGANSMLLTLVARICRLRAVAERNVPVDFALRADFIEQKLHAVRACNSGGLLFELLLEVYRASALLLLYRTLGSMEASPALVEIMTKRSYSCHENLICYLQRISVDAVLAPALVFPLFIAGANATSTAQQTFTREQMKALYNRLRFGNIDKALSVLEDIWASQILCTRPGWTSSIQWRSWKLALV